MASPKFCWFSERLIGPEEASTLTRSGLHSRDDFRCPECFQAVRVAIGQTELDDSGRTMVDHFEHWVRNSDCSLSTLAPGQRRTAAAKVRGDPAARATEGRRQEVSLTISQRSRTLVKEKLKTGDHRCEACYFRLAFENKYVIECHHTDPLNRGERITTLEHLMLLCPTCHSIAHLQKDPMSIEQIRTVRKLMTHDGP